MESALILRAFSSISSADSRACNPPYFADGVASTCCLSSCALKEHAQFSSVKGCPLNGKCLERVSFGRTSRFFVAKAEVSSDGSVKPIAPLQPESPSGQLLVQLLRSHPHLVLAAAEQQLEKLAKDRDAANVTKPPSTMSSNLVLYRRIAELKAKERSKTVEEIIYALIVEKFMKAGISMIPKFTSLCFEYGRVRSWPVQDRELESMHTPEVLEMIRGHLTLVLAAFSYLNDNTSSISQVHLGLLYVASVMYGYFLRRVDRRFQLEKSVNLLSSGLHKAIDVDFDELCDKKQIGGQLWNIGGIVHSEILEAQIVALATSLSGSDKMQGLHPSTVSLKVYLMSCDSETLQRYSTIRSQESMCVIENHTEALVGTLPGRQTLRNGSIELPSKDEMVKVSLSGLRGLVLEAVTFGSFLWDVESYVDLHYNCFAQ